MVYKLYQIYFITIKIGIQIVLFRLYKKLTKLIKRQKDVLNSNYAKMIINYFILSSVAFNVNIFQNFILTTLWFHAD